METSMDVYRILELALTSLLGLATIIFGAKFAGLRKKLAQIANLISDIDKAQEDNTLTQEEMKHIVDDVMVLLGKK